MSSSESQPQVYQARVKRDFGISPLWILPLVTLVLAGWLVGKAINDAGQRVQIYFSDAQGLIAGRTKIQYQGLEVGMVRDISLAPDLSNIYVDADIYPQAIKLLGEDTRFWLVKPSASLSGVSGLDALVSGNYIAIEPGESLNEHDAFPREYTALDARPADLKAEQGLNITLRSRDLASISIGSQIVYRKIPIGEVYSYELSPGNKYVLINAFIKTEFSHLITDKSRFWNVSGVGAQIGFNGIDVQLDSLSALLAGAIAVDSPDGGEPILEDRQFNLYPDLKTAGRGIPIKITLPDNSNIGSNGAPIMYRGIEVGQITDLALSEGREQIIASAAIQPAFSDTLNLGSRFMLEEPSLSLSDVDNLSNLITGNFLTLIPGEGKKTRSFTAIRKDALLREQASSIAIELIADNSFGLSAGTDILYRGLTVGAITDVQLQDDQIRISALIDAQYRSLLRSNNRFFVTGSATAELTESGLNVTVPPAKQLLTGSISFIKAGEEQIPSEYRLFASQSLAELATYNQTGSKTLVLISDELPPVSKGSPLLYRNLAVGKVTNYALTDQGVKVEVRIENQYHHLINKQTTFWNRSGVEIDASLAGVNITAAPLKSLVQGGIAFDTLPGVENKSGKAWRLYKNFSHAKKFGRLITLTTKGKLNLAKGAAIKFQGVSVGEVIALKPLFERNEVQIEARIFPEFTKNIVRQGSHFWLVTPKIGLGGIDNIDSVLGSYIAVQPGAGKHVTDFTLAKAPTASSGVHFTLQNVQRNSVSVGTPLLYRGIEVGLVTQVALGTFADRVVSTIKIQPEYAYLVRQDSVFWNVSGVNVNIGLSGAQIKAGTVDSLLRGGITFATPEGNSLQPEAKPGQSFILHAEAKESWLLWRTAIPKP